MLSALSRTAILFVPSGPFTDQRHAQKTCPHPDQPPCTGSAEQRANAAPEKHASDKDQSACLLSHNIDSLPFHSMYKKAESIALSAGSV